MGDGLANRILIVFIVVVGAFIGILGWVVLTYSRAPNACRAHGGAQLGVRAPGPALPERVVCQDGAVVPLDPPKR